MIEIDLDGNLLKRTASLESGKANASLDNVTTDAGANLNSAGARTVTQAWSSGTSFYRVYSDGFIEQGGYVTQASPMTITLNKAFTETNYNIQLTCVRADSTIAPSSAALSINKTKTSFQATGNVGSTNSYWFACGF